MRNSTLLFLIKKEGNTISEICLPMKKRGFGVGRYNGVGGKVNPMEPIEAAARREAFEEIGVDVGDMTKVAELTFTFPHHEDWNQVVHAYVSPDWKGEITESEEMKPHWFAVADIPYKEMWPDDIFWLPKVLTGELVKARFTFGEGDVIKAQEVNVIPSF
jgi:8-oxo-dGTP pyrophosphatase MutT (NUDIX family)